MDIVIFEDSKLLCGILEKYLSLNFDKDFISVALATDDISEVTAYAERAEEFDLPCIYIIDIEIHKKKFLGLKAAKIIKDRHKKSFVVVITNYAERIMFDTYHKLQTFNVILKKNPRFYREVITTIKMVRKEYEGDLILIVHNCRYDQIQIPVNDILFIETVKGERKARIYSENGTFEMKRNLKQITRTLTSSFVRCHNSYIVNVEKVIGVNFATHEITLCNGQICYFSYLKKSLLQNKLKENQGKKK